MGYIQMGYIYNGIGNIMQIIDCQQGTDEWFEAKLGVVSTSNFSKVLNKGSGRKLYMRKLAAERLTGVTQVSYSDGNMEAGQTLEPAARGYYELLHDCIVDEVGFVKRDEWTGCSPDGLVGTEGEIEIKCPIPSTHIENILRGKMQTVYTPQVQGQLWVTDRKWCDWISYCPSMPRRLFCVRVFRDEEYIKELAINVTMFVTELKKMVEKLTVSEF